MKAFARSRWPLLAVIALLVAGSALAYGGYIDPTALVAAPLMFPVGLISEPNAKVVRELLAKRQTVFEAAQAIQAAAIAANLDLTAEQTAAIDAKLAEIAGIDSNVKRLQALMEAERGVPIAGNILETRPNVLEDPKRGFKHFGDFAMATFRASPVGGADLDDRLKPQAAVPGATYSNESAGGDGGYLVPTEFAKDITKISLQGESFLSRTDPFPISGNSITFPSDETTPWGTNGVRAYWAVEAAQATATKPIIKPNTMRLNKLFALVPVTDELLADSPAIGAYLSGLMGRSIKWKCNDAIMNGTGAGQPLGVLNAPALVVIAKEGGQAANTIDPNNIAKMYAAMPADYLPEAEWVVAPDALPKLITLTLGNFAIWTPPMQGFVNAPGGFLLGKPINLSQTAAAFSSQGDISFVNFKAYRTISKDGIQIAESMHLYFDADTTAFRATFRIDGQPTFKQSVAQARGVQALSPYVALGVR